MRGYMIWERLFNVRVRWRLKLSKFHSRSLHTNVAIHSFQFSFIQTKLPYEFNQWIQISLEPLFLIYYIQNIMNFKSYKMLKYWAGFSLFLGLVMDRQHYYIREITLLRKSLEIAKKQTHSREPPKIREEEETEKKKDKQEEKIRRKPWTVLKLEDVACTCMNVQC